MIDGIKILNLPVNITELLQNDLLVFPLPINEKDGEILQKHRFSDYRGMLFDIHNNNVKLYGSFHKYNNDGKHNYNDFYYTDLLNTIIDLCNKFKVNPKQSILNNVEFGVNIILPFAPDNVLKSIVNYRGNPFQSFNIKGAKGKECVMNDFIIKIYDKSNQYNLNSNILRFEIKVIRMKYFAEKGINIKYLSDLLQNRLFFKLGAILKTVFNEILFYDTSINLNKLSTRERLILSNGRNSDYWTEIKPKSKDFQGGNQNRNYINQRKKYDRQLKNFKDLHKKYSLSTMQTDISELIEKKYKDLSNYNENLRGKLTDFLNSFENINRGKLTDFETQKENSKKGQTNISNIVLDYPFNNVKLKRECLTCKKDISEKRFNAKFCSKKCKNDYTNPKLNSRNNLKKRIEKLEMGLNLFENDKFIILKEHQKELLKKQNSIYNSIIPT